LGEAAMARTITTVSQFCATAKRLGAQEILIVATSAVRDAGNRQVFLERIHRATGLAVRVVPGEEEARLALLGTLHGLATLSGSLLLLDIGGGAPNSSWPGNASL
ncbi:MAG: Ppx/GppA family phosphatase, partial [Candidatus Rokubacteria bacterium]|nr:Ppx/GppA family phosphatase [Candidatus Rokubacteria bacterium]